MKKKPDAIKLLDRTLAVLIAVVMAVYCLSMLIPLVWMLLVSLKDDFNYAVSVYGFPDRLMFSNYIDVFNFMKCTALVGGKLIEFDFLDMLFNSCLRSFLIPLITVGLNCLCAYPIARYRFVGKKLLFGIGMFVMIVPIVGSLSTTMLLYRQLGVYDNTFLYIITRSSCAFSGVYFLVFVNTFRSLPKELSEAAELDGAGHYRVLFRIFLPMILPTFATFYILNFLGVWNEYESTLYWLPSHPNIPYGLYIFQMDATHGNGANMPTIMAGFVVVMIPAAVLYIASQKLVRSNFVMGGVKG